MGNLLNARIGGYLLAGMFLMLGFGSLYLCYDSYVFDKNCIGVIGELDNSYIKKCRAFLCSYSVEYKFEYEGKTYTGYDTVDAEPVMKAIPVYFLPDNPKNNRIERGRILKALMIGMFMFALGGWKLRSLQNTKPTAT